ncbi:restriction endonuclease subunit S [Sulfuricurvum sp.]|uniref:restriction endonuclease subunit S n=1 Tax=Sulfuricurvum sp. TaxID=2025608 RepID=UPI003BAE7ADB
MKIKPLKDLCHNYKADIVDGPFGSNMKRSDYSEDGIPVLKIQNIKPFKIEIKKMDFVTESKYAELKRHSYKKGDIVMTKLGDPLGASAIVEDIDDGLIVADLVRIRAEKIDTKYLCYHLNSPITNDFINTQQKGATRPRVQISVVRDLPIYAPPLPEQQRIVAILDEAFTAIEGAKANAIQNLKNAKELFDSYLQSVFENKVHGSLFETLDSLCELIVDCEHKTAPTQDTGYPSIRTPNIGKGVLILDNVNRVSEETYNEWTRRAIPQADDLILAREAPAGNIAVIPENIKVCLGQRTVLIRPKKSKLVSKFLAYLILSKDVQEQLLSHSTGATVEHINMKDIRAFKIYNLSPLPEQKTIVQKLDLLSAQTKRLEAIYQQKIDNLEELKKSILQKAFNGEL